MKKKKDENKNAIKNKKDTIYIDPKFLSEGLHITPDPGPSRVDELRPKKK